MNIFRMLKSKQADCPSLKIFSLLLITTLFVLISATSLVRITTAQANSAKELIGLWEAKRHFGPDSFGTLLVWQMSGRWQAEIAGYSAPAKLDNDSISF